MPDLAPPRKSPHLAVVGAGIGGLATAIALRQAGLPVTVFEQSPVFGEVGTGISLWPNATRLLRDWGVLEPILAAGETVEWFDLRRPDGRLIAALSMQGFDCPAICLHRADLHEALRAPLDPADLVAGHRFGGFAATPAGLELEFTEGRHHHADALIGADGINSAVRAQLHGASEAIDRGYTVWRGVTAAPPGLAAGRISETWGAGRRFGLMPIGRGKLCWYATCNPRETPPLGADQKAHLQTLFSGWHEPIGAVVAATDPAQIIRTAARDRAPLRHWGRGAVTLLGDAVHPITPNLGQGSCLAIEDAAAVAHHLRQAANPAAAFRAYEAARRGRTAKVARQARLIGWLGQVESPALAALRTLLAGLYLRIPRDLRKNWLYAYRG